MQANLRLLPLIPYVAFFSLAYTLQRWWRFVLRFLPVSHRLRHSRKKQHRLEPTPSVCFVGLLFFGFLEEGNPVLVVVRFVFFDQGLLCVFFLFFFFIYLTHQSIAIWSTRPKSIIL